MRLRYVAMLCVFVLIASLMPFLVEFSYKTDNPKIIWSYSQSDILNYSAAVIGIFIAMLALFLAIDENRVKIRFDIASTVDEDGDLCFEFRVINIGKTYCKIEQFGLSTMFRPIKVRIFGHTFLFYQARGQKRMHLVKSAPFELQPGDCHDVIIKYKEVNRDIEQIYDANEKIELFVSFIPWKHFYRKANEIRKMIKFNYFEKEHSQEDD